MSDDMMAYSIDDEPPARLTALDLAVILDALGASIKRGPSDESGFPSSAHRMVWEKVRDVLNGVELRVELD